MQLVFLGIEIDSQTMGYRLPQDKLSSLSDAISEWKNRRKCLKRELLSLIGSLSFACCVIKPGRIFLHRLINLFTTVSKLSHHINLTATDLDGFGLFSYNLGMEFLFFSPSQLPVRSSICSRMHLLPELGVTLMVCGFRLRSCLILKIFTLVF